VAWVTEIASFVKSLAPRKLFVDGTYGINADHLQIEEVDIFSDHFYPVSLSTLRSDLSLGKAIGRAK
jgi:mannan endo-1,4-beta-mannosidase